MPLYQLEELQGVLIVAGVRFVGPADHLAHDFAIAFSIYCRDIQQLGDIEQPELIEQLFVGGGGGRTDPVVEVKRGLGELRVDSVLLGLLLDGLSFAEGRWLVPRVLTSRQHRQAALQAHSQRLARSQLYPQLLLVHVQQQVQVLCYFVEGEFEGRLCEFAELPGVKGVTLDHRQIIVVHFFSRRFGFVFKLFHL